ncbi:MAG: hypothetical protein KHY83_08160, partial [Coriobacteriia bacterium]|nr:hypothetical protein [Coriobacteriia bacterium]
MGMIWFLIVFPLVAAGLCLVVRERRAREIIVCAAAVVIAIASIAFAGGHLTGGSTLSYGYHNEALSWLFLVIELALCAYVM